MKKILIIAAAFIAGCAQTPNQFILAPNLEPVMGPSAKLTNLSVQDLRHYQHLVQINSGDEKLRLINSDKSVQHVIKSSLNSRLNQQRIANNNISYRIDIIELITKVNQETFKYQSNSTIEILVSIGKDSGTLNKTFKRNSQSYGPLNADLAVIERDFNLLLGQLLDNIATDSELVQYITR